MVPWHSQEISVELLPCFKLGSCLHTEQNFAKAKLVGFFCLDFLRKLNSCYCTASSACYSSHKSFNVSVSPNPVCYTAWNTRVTCCLQPFEDPRLWREGTLFFSTHLISDEELQTAQLKSVWDGSPHMQEATATIYSALSQPQDVLLPPCEHAKEAGGDRGECWGRAFGWLCGHMRVCVCVQMCMTTVGGQATMYWDREGDESTSV